MSDLVSAMIIGHYIGGGGGDGGSEARSARARALAAEKNIDGWIKWSDEYVKNTDQYIDAQRLVLERAIFKGEVCQVLIEHLAKEVGRASNGERVIDDAYLDAIYDQTQKEILDSHYGPVLTAWEDKISEMVIKARDELIEKEKQEQKEREADSSKHG